MNQNLVDRSTIISVNTNTNGSKLMEMFNDEGTAGNQSCGNMANRSVIAVESVGKISRPNMEQFLRTRIPCSECGHSRSI